MEIAGIWAQRFPRLSLVPTWLLSSSNVGWSYLPRPVMTQQAGDTFGQHRLQQHCLCGSLASISPCSFQKNLYAHSSPGCLPKFSCCWLQFRSTFILAIVAALKTAWRLQPLLLTRTELMIYQWGLCGKLGFRHKGPSARGLTAGTSRYIKHPAFRDQSPFTRWKN